MTASSLVRCQSLEFCAGDEHRVRFRLPSSAYRAEVSRPKEEAWDRLCVREIAVDAHRERA
jgi:hypothetical protein